MSIELVWQLAGYETIAGAFKEIEPEHFLMALLKFADLPVGDIEKLGAGTEAVQALSSDVQGIREDLSSRGINATALRRAIREGLGQGRHKYEGGQIHRSEATRAYFNKAAVMASASGNDGLTVRHILSALLAEPTPTVAKAIAECSARENKPPTAPKMPVLDEFEKELHGQKKSKKEKRHNRLAEAKAIVQVLAQPHRNCVLLNTGSSQLAREVLTGVAQLLESKDIPAALQGKKLVDVSEIEVAGENCGSNLDRIQAMMHEAAAAKNVILVLPQLEPQGQAGGPSGWALQLQAMISSVACQFVARLAPELKGYLKNNQAWNKRTHIITLQEKITAGIPDEL